jgi:Raf kinase inhibitor-like YbhB/YbcL family protein
MTLKVSSPAFSNGASIPTRFTCDGQDVAPPLEWSGVPSEAKTVAVICEDPDAPSGTFTHWVLYDVPASSRGIREGAASIGKAGKNDFGRTGFGGPCPPKKDAAHHYHFHVYALDLDTLGPAGLSKQDALRAMRGHILAEDELTGTYQRATA